MALQGSIDSFALADVLRLLGSTAKTGRLILTGDRGTGNLWMADGEIVGGETTAVAASPDPVDAWNVVFDMMRFDVGSFVFESDGRCPDPHAGVPTEPVLQQSELALAELRQLAAEVPSSDQVLVLRASLEVEEVVVGRRDWAALAAIGGGRTLAELGGALGVGELETMRIVRDLLLQRLAEVREPSTRQEVAPASPARRAVGVPVGPEPPLESEPVPVLHRVEQASVQPEQLEAWSSDVPRVGATAPEAVLFEPMRFEAVPFEPGPFDDELAGTEPAGPASSIDDEGWFPLGGWEAEDAEVEPQAAGDDGGVEADEGEAWSAVAPEPSVVALASEEAEIALPDGLEELFGDFDPFGAVPVADVFDLDEEHASSTDGAGRSSGPEVEPDPAPGAVRDDETGTRWPLAAGGTTDASDPAPPLDAAAELARQMAMLSPKAAQAIAAATAETSDDESRAHVVRFLGSV